MDYRFVIAPLALVVACQADPTTAGGALAPKLGGAKTDAAQPEVTKPEVTQPKATQPASLPSAPRVKEADLLRHRSRSVSAKDFRPVAHDSPAPEVHRVEVDPSEPADDEPSDASKTDVGSASK